MPKCPKCDQSITRVKIDAIEVEGGRSDVWPGSAFSCPHCSAVLSVGFDHVAVRAELVQDIVRALRQR